ncbi:uncharacterized protein LOC105834324 [Monomorium pharaonis]|uniref:uncharacterized protein LOC105834324 n=1 Tax=Monomorium pharaonis TaxID=307658 RepID=UPI00174609F7|nr:uncharacterized protein LOC105834324 [Monomorium pharaonis]
MTKITIINCIIVAVCVFQTTNAGLFDLPLGGSWDNINKQISNTLGNAKELGDKIEKEVTDRAKKLGNEIETRKNEALEDAKKLGNEIETRGKEAIDNIKNGIKNAQNELQNGLDCANMYTEGQTIIEDVLKEFNTCIGEKTSGVSEDIKNLTNAISTIQADLQNILQCTANITLCLNEASQIAPKLEPEFENIVNTAYDLIDILPNVGGCFTGAINKLNNETLEKLINNAKQCANSVFQQFKLYL